MLGADSISDESNSSGNESLKDAIIEIIRCHTSVDAFRVIISVKRKRRSITPSEVERALGELINEGRISKNEKNHYQVAE